MDNQSLEQRREQAKTAFLATLAAAHKNPNGKDIVEQLAQLLGGMEGLGEENLTPQELAIGIASIPNLKDEFGNPIVEIREDIKEANIASPSRPALAPDPVHHLWDMPPEAAASKRLEIDKMWEELEQEEEQWFEQEKRKELGSGGSQVQTDTTREQPLAPPPVSRQAQPPETPTTKELRKSKSVKFADGTAPGNLLPTPSVEWGDVVPGALRRGAKPTPRETSVMKFDVVERVPGPSTLNMSRQPDSDDEDENEDQRQSDDSDEDPSLVGVHSDNTDDDDNIPGDVASDDEDEDVAAMQQQVAADYYARRDGVFRAAERSGLGTAPRREASSHSSDDWNQEFVPLDANAIVSQPKTPPGVSRFKASLLSQPSVPITAIGPDAREIIKEGKLVDDKLLVPADSESDDGGIGEKGRKIIEELRRRDSDFDQDQAQSIAVLRDPEAGPSMSKGKENAAPSHKPPQRAMGGIMERPLNKRTNGQTPSPSANPGKLSSSLFASNIVASGVASRGPPKPTRPESSSDPQSVDSSQLHATIVDSPSFRPVTRGTQASEQGMTKPSVADTVMARDVLERPPRAKANASTAPPLVSRFKAERM